MDCQECLDFLSTEDNASEVLRMHCQRVSYWALEIARSINLSVEERRALEQAALMHHTPYILINTTAQNKLFHDLGFVPEGESSISTRARAILERFNNVRGSDESANDVRLASILEMAETFDEYFEFEPFRDPTEDPDPEIESIADCLQVRSRADITASPDDLPVWPKAAQLVMRALANADTGARELAQVAKSDPVLASGVIRVANSALFGGQRAISDLSRAVTQIGVPSARKILLGLAVRPLFASSSLKVLWTHSLAAANAAHHLGDVSGRCNPEEAFLAGLVHDIGRLLIHRVPVDAQDRYQSLIEKGCPDVMVERLVFRQDHAAIGSELLRYWSFSEELCEAVMYHHRPERTKSLLPAILYLAEVSVGAKEDLASVARLNAAAARIGVPIETAGDPIATDRSVVALAS